MGIGASIFLIALGAIFAFAVDANLGWLNLNVVGWVLMLAGVAGLLTTLYFWNSRRRVVAAPVRERVVAEPVAPVREDRVVREEYREVRGPGSGYPA
ncbi:MULTISPECIES: DUF6458 family protein [Micromonospora]|uniref:DUF6458 domain-containing protein n=1 Tax=Micromonospora chalcea TaxID=1874 RepID=A0ABX9XZV9_MICCH|nr:MULTISPECIES: DUF6458 family protein [Micromonospora]EWM66686.1 hypothetical protein MCBG_03819 [Micromonospora sp. M42]MBC8993195.1 hypothetical protein [Micromonospora chalcea]MBP1786485.1 hypothetical protein [Micromonospora sp. HB375]MBQ1062682.1 hypothetical protein [Micromonospora sp. C41]MBQ1067376.1 hypothetical protein [Micromonospora sp. D75]